MDAEEVTKLAKALQSDDARLRSDAASALAEAADAEVDLSPAISALAAALGDSVGEIRAAAAYTLVSVAEHGGDILPALSALSKALSDDEEDVRREAVWALYCLIYAGKDITAAASELERSLGDPSQSVRGNGAIALTLHYLNHGAEAKATELLDGEAGSIQFGAAWGSTDHCRQRQKKTELQALMKRIRPGLLDVAIRDGIVGSIHSARERGEDISFELGAVDELLAQTEDAVEQAPLYGILMKLKSGGGS